MKNYIFIAQCSIALLLCLSTSNVCMEIELSSKEYFKQCEKIDTYYEQKLNNLILSVTQDNAAEKIKKFEHKFFSHQQTIEKEKNIFFCSVKQKYNIDDDIWSIIKNITEKLHEFRNQTRWQSSKDIIHDPVIPQWFMAILKKQLIKIGCNPQGINIRSTEKTGFSVYGCRINWSYKSDDQWLYREFKKPGEILINCNYLTMNNNNLEADKGKCMFIAQNILMYDSLNVLLVAEGFNIDTKRSEWNLLDKVNFLHCLLAPALKSSQGAHCIKSFCRDVYCSGLCTQENYKQLSSIDFCWKALEWLKKYYTINYHCIPLLFFVKNKYSAEAKYLLDKGMVITKNIVEKAENDFILKNELQNFYDEQQCCVCLEHPEDMRDMPCENKHLKNFICRQCYNNLAYNDLNQRICPLCLAGFFSYSNTTDYSYLF